MKLSGTSNDKVNLKKVDHKCYASQFDKEDLILRDFLATDRTSLANERTLLAYVRTSLSVIASGVGFIKLFDYRFLTFLGYACFPLGIIILIYGFQRYNFIHKKIRRIKF